jgi:UDP-4-amino-4,6-dideoxy-N-acetyl-beta-L-altrosamine transaminase
MIPYGRQSISQDDIDAVVDVLKSDFLTQGPVVPQFEKYVANYCDTKYAIAVNSASSALHLACLALGVEKGDWVWTSPITFVASANCALYCGADVDFVDIDSQSYNLSIEKLKFKLEQSKKIGRLPKVIVAVHLAGQSCDMEAIYKLSQRYDFKIIEDASHAIGGKYKNRPIGSCQYSHITIFSFHPVKIITTGEGGMALTNDIKLARQIQLLRSHGITRKTSEMTEVPDGPWYYQQVELGFNYRMTDLQAALGLSQIQKLNEFIKQRHSISERYKELLADLPVVIPWQDPESYSSFHLYVIRLKLDEINMSHREVFEALHDGGIGVNLHYIPVYHQPYYTKLGFQKGYCLEAEHYYSEAISLPMYFDLTENQQNKVVTILMDIL